MSIDNIERIRVADDFIKRFGYFFWFSLTRFQKMILIAFLPVTLFTLFYLWNLLKPIVFHNYTLRCTQIWQTSPIFWIKNGDTLLKMDGSILIELTGIGDSESMSIKAFSIEVKDKKKGWIKCRHFPIEDNAMVYLGKQTKGLNEIEFDHGFFRQNMRDKRIPAGDVVRGWLLLKFEPNNNDVIVNDSPLRITFVDQNSNKEIYIIPAKKERSEQEDVLPYVGFRVVSKPIDMSSLRIQ